MNRRARYPYTGDSAVPQLNHATARSTTLYRLYDERGHLLYVGVTRRPDLRDRFNAHRRTQPWWRDVAAVEIEQYPAEHLALDAERAAIKAERPAYNRRSAVAA